MKFKSYKPSRVNEELSRVPNMETEEDIVTAVDPGYSDAIRQHKKIKDKLNKDFKESEKGAKDFVKDNHKRETKVRGSSEMKKLKLTESNEFDDEEYHITNIKVHLMSDDRHESEAFDDNESEAWEFIEAEKDNWDTIIMYKFMENELGDEESEEIVVKEDGEYQMDISVHESLNEEDEHFFAIKKDKLKEDTVDIDTSKKKRVRGKNEKPDIADYSSEDLWYAVYDELAAEVTDKDHREINRQIKARNSQRYDRVYPYGDSSIVVYASSPDKFDFAKQVADHFGVHISDVKEDKSSRATDEYKYRVIIDIPEEKMYQTDIAI